MSITEQKNSKGKANVKSYCKEQWLLSYNTFKIHCTQASTAFKLRLHTMKFDLCTINIMNIIYYVYLWL